MNHSRKFRWAIAGRILLLLGMLTIGNLGPASVQAAQGPAVQRPISDFLDAQGTTMVFNTPVPDQLGWANNPSLSNSAKPPPFRFALFDYSGLANDYLILQTRHNNRWNHH
jgi:hypothetical protein